MVFGFASIIAAINFDRGLPRFGRGPQIVIKDTQLWSFLHDPLSFGIWPRLTLATVRVLEEPLAIPHYAADVHLVVEDAVAPLCVAVDGAETPIAATGCADPVPV